MYVRMYVHKLKLLWYHEYTHKIHLLGKRAINVAHYLTMMSLSGSFYSDNTENIFWIGSGFGQSRSDPD